MQVIQQVERAFWLDVARACPYATFFHTPFWQELALTTFPEYRDATIGAVLPSGVRAVLPLLSVRQRGPFQNLWSTFELYYGGIIADGPISEAEAKEIYLLASGWKTLNLQLTGNPFHPDLGFPTAWASYSDFTQMVALQPDFEAVFAGFSKNCRNTYRAGVRKGVQVRLATSIEDCRTYFAAYQDGLERWDRKGVELLGTAYTWRQFDLCYQLMLQHPEIAQLWLAEIDGKIVAGNWVFYWNQHAACWDGAAFSEYLGYRPFNVLDVEVMRAAAARGFTRYDFGPSGGVNGVISYKDSYNPDRLPVSRFDYTAAGVQVARRIAQPLLSRRNAQA